MTRRIDWIRSLGAVMIGLCAAGWEIAVRPFLPGPVSIPALLPLLVLLLMSSTRFRGYLVTITASLCLQLYLIGAQDLLLVRWLLVFVVLDLLAMHFLTNRSFYVAVALASIGYVLERVTSFLFGTIGWQIGFSSYPWTLHQHLFAGFVWTVILTGMGFLILAFFTKRFSPSMTRSTQTRFL